MFEPSFLSTVVAGRIALAAPGDASNPGRPARRAISVSALVGTNLSEWITSS